MVDVLGHELSAESAAICQRERPCRVTLKPLVPTWHCSPAEQCADVGQGVADRAGRHGVAVLWLKAEELLGPIGVGVLHGVGLVEYHHVKPVPTE